MTFWRRITSLKVEVTQEFLAVLNNLEKVLEQKSIAWKQSSHFFFRNYAAEGFNQMFFVFDLRMSLGPWKEFRSWAMWCHVKVVNCPNLCSYQTIRMKLPDLLNVGQANLKPKRKVSMASLRGEKVGRWKLRTTGASLLRQCCNPNGWSSNWLSKLISLFLIEMNWHRKACLNKRLSYRFS